MLYIKIQFIGLLLCWYSYTFGQHLSGIDGMVLDSATREPIEGAYVYGEDFLTSSDADGRFTIPTTGDSLELFRVSHIGYVSIEISIHTNRQDQDIVVELHPASTSLAEINIQAKTDQRLTRESTWITHTVSGESLNHNRAGSLMQTLRKIPGIGASAIGSGHSRPTIRGLGFNRVVVVQDGIKHEAQQWGADHGLEIDQYGIDQIRIVKGPASLLHGSDAIAGLIDIRPPAIPTPDTLAGEVELLGESNNLLAGLSAGLWQRKSKWYYRGRLTGRAYADYTVPTDQINYGNYIIDLYDNHLRNTAGHELNTRWSLGYVADHIQSELSVSNVYSKNGFFANAHGLEVRTSHIDYDRRNRDIDWPLHYVNHFKITHHTTLTSGTHNFHLDWGFQNNQREEHSEPIAHGYMPAPDGSKERQFTKNTISLNVRDEWNAFSGHTITMGLNSEWQQNRIGGWGFLIPEYQRFTAGFFFTDHWTIMPDLNVQGGLRYDIGRLQTRPYFDWFETPVKNEEGGIEYQHLQRARAHRFEFGHVSASAGVSYLRHRSTFKLILGKSFRMPQPHELASDGVNYHMYRYEKGHPDLDPETAWQLDFEFDHTAENWNLNISPFVNYFGNYIYLNPSARYYETLQIYDYSQSRVFRVGGEISTGVSLNRNLQLEVRGEYVRSRQLSGLKKGFTLPFSPPLSGVFTLRYGLDQLGFVKQPLLTIDYRETAAQNRIVPPEESTEGFRVFDIALTGQIRRSGAKAPIEFRVKLNNVFDTKYFEHSSFYRLISVPEPGRNATLSITIPFNH